VPGGRDHDRRGKRKGERKARENSEEKNLLGGRPTFRLGRAEARAAGKAPEPTPEKRVPEKRGEKSGKTVDLGAETDIPNPK